jgi:hypothetical protein
MACHYRSLLCRRFVSGRSPVGSKRKRDYLFLRPGSQYWRVRLQADGRSIEKSLGTSDRAEAEVLALPYIASTRPSCWRRDHE